MFIDWDQIEEIKRKYPHGTQIVLNRMGDDPHPIPPGTKGAVLFVDDIGTVHCRFENGRRLGLVPGEDSFSIVKEKDRGDAR